MELLVAVCTKYKISPFVVFKMAYDHFKDFTHRNHMEAHFKDFCFVNSKGELILHKCPQIVEDYCLYVLAKRIEPEYKGTKFKEG